MTIVTMSSVRPYWWPHYEDSRNDQWSELMPQWIISPIIID